MQARRALLAEQAGRRKRDNLFAAAAAVVVLALAVSLQILWFSSDPTAEDLARIDNQMSSPATGIPDPSTAAGRVFSGTLELDRGSIGVELDGNTAPQAAAVFKSLADSGFFDGKNCHRLTTGEAMGVLQCGSGDGEGTTDPSYQWGPAENTPADGKYPAGTIAVARGDSTDSQGTQFFIVYKDSYITQASGGYTIMGKVTSGLDVVESIAAEGTDSAGSQDGKPKTPVTIDSFTLK